jgi:hypothetical protein
MALTPARRAVLERSLVALALAAWFLDHTWRGLLCTFQGDDMMNLYRAWVLPVKRLALGNLTPFTAVYRPVGSLFYKFMYAAAGFHPLPYRIAIYALLLLNIALLYRFARLLTGSAESASLAALFGSYHNHLIDLYQNGGAVYDVLCYTFFFGAINCYIAGRDTLRGGTLVRFLVLSVLALNSKEMALTLAAVLWAYEFVYRAPVFWRNKLPLWILTVATPLSALAKTGPASFFYGSDGYQLHLTWAQWIETTRDWIEGLLYLPYQSLSATGAVLVLLLPWAIALFVRDRERREPFLLCAALVWLLPLPVNFIDKRNFFVMYIPLAAWSVIAAQSLVGARDWLLKRAPAIRVHPAWPRIALIAGTVVALHAAQHHDHFRGFEWIDPSQPNIRALAAGLAQHCPSLPPDGKIEILDDPFDKSSFDPLFIARLWTHREDIEVHRDPPAKSNPPADRYDCTLAYR